MATAPPSPMPAAAPVRQPPTNDKLLFAAARSGDSAALLRLVATAPAASVRATDPEKNGWTLLHMFAGASRLGMAEMLLRVGAEVDARDSMFRTPLHMAARGGFPLPEPAGAPMVVEDTKDKDKDTGKKNKGATNDQIAVLQKLLVHGARVSARDCHGFTALHFAAQAGNTAVVEHLLDLNMWRGRTAAQVRRGGGEGNSKTRDQVRLPRAPIHADSNQEDTPLHLAALGGHTETVEALLKRGADGSRTNFRGMEPLHLAVLGGESPAALATVQLLVCKPWFKDCNVKASNGQTPLHVAAEHGFTAQVKLLLSSRGGRSVAGRKARIDVRDKAQKTPKDLAAAAGFTDIVALLDKAAEDALRAIDRVGLIVLDDPSGKKKTVTSTSFSRGMVLAASRQ